MDLILLQKKIQENLLFNGTSGIVNPDHLAEEVRDVHLMNRNALSSILQELVETLSKSSLGTSPVIHFGIADSYRIDAFAARLDPSDPKLIHHYLISIFHGVFQNFFSLYWGLLSHPKILPDIGQPNDEHPPFVHNKGLLDFCFNFPEATNQMEEFGRTWVTSFYPEDRNRQIYAQILANLSIEYLFMHELSHILGGHIGYLMADKEKQGLFHFQPTILGSAAYHLNKGIPNIKVFEYEADLIAGGLMASIVKFDRSLLGSFLEQEVSPPQDMYQALALAILILFHLFQEIRISYKKPQPYPEPDIRFWAAYGGITSHLRDEYGDEGVIKFENAFSWAVKAYLGIIIELKLPVRFAFIGKKNYEGMTELDALEEARKKLDPVLYPHSLWRQAKS
ncbi:MAG: hypothetical protein R3C61_16435 [Bacteroidia bacterium]